ncbi:MAG: DUF2079 domain-containing protein [Patescibacteria group bacterium]
MSKLFSFIKHIFKPHYLFYLTILVSLGVFAIAIKINLFRYNNFDYGKFDLGNMAQMVWYTAHGGKLMWLTDYFGTNLPRWAMSHVDPILLIFVPIFYFYPHAMILVYAQLILVIFSSLIIYKLAKLHLKSDLAAFFISMAYLLYPAIGFLIAWTGFHGVTAVIPFFLLAFYLLESMEVTNNFTKTKLILFWAMVVLALSGKEEISLFILIWGIFVMLFRKSKRIGLYLSFIGLFWFVMTFMIIIPAYSHYRIEGYQRFAQNLDLVNANTTDVELPNFFLSRYDGFGESYSEIAKTVILNPTMVVRVVLGGDKLDNLRQTFAPMAYTPILYPPLLVIALPEFAINYLTTAEGVGTSEIINHRISMIIPVLFISTIYGIMYLVTELAKKSKLINKNKNYFVIAVSGLVFVTNLYTTFSYNNPIYLWFTQAVSKRLPFNALSYAKTADAEVLLGNLAVGDRFTLSPLENKDRECALKIVNSIPAEASVTGPDYLGAHLGLRETYGIFPSLYNEADYVIVDVFAQKVLRILDLDTSFIRNVVGEILKSDEYKLDNACGNMFVFKHVGKHKKTLLLPLQERYKFEEKVDLEIFKTLTVVDYSIPDTIIRGENADVHFAYVKRENEALHGNFLFMSFVNERTGELYQVANLPSFGVLPIADWSEDRYYLEDNVLALPKYLDAGKYRFFVGISDNVRTRSIYIKTIDVK